MKSRKNYLGLVLMMSFMFFGCQLKGDVEGDVDAPVIEIISPINNEIFYTDDGYLNLIATADDVSIIDFASVEVLNSVGEPVFRFDRESTITHGGVSFTVDSINAVFETITPGNYQVVFRFQDGLGNDSSATRTAICVQSSGGGDGTDGPG